VDVRTDGEFATGHIKGAVHCSVVPPWSFQHRLEQLNLDKEKLVIPICLTAHRSIPAQKVLTGMGFKAKQVQGGMKGWRKDKLPEAKDETTKQRNTEGEHDGKEKEGNEGGTHTDKGHDV